MKALLIIIAILCGLLGFSSGFIVGERFGNPANIQQDVYFFEAADSWDIQANGPIFNAPTVVKPDPAGK
jgi:hypothetical protein